MPRGRTCSQIVIHVTVYDDMVTYSSMEDIFYGDLKLTLENDWVVAELIRIGNVCILVYFLATVSRRPQ